MNSVVVMETCTDRSCQGLALRSVNAEVPRNQPYPIRGGLPATRPESADPRADLKKE